MPGSYGALPFPVGAAAATASSGDPLLDTLASFFQAAITARCNTAWQALAPGTGAVVQAVQTNNPESEAFRPQGSPRLFLWRDAIYPAKWRAAEWRIRPSKLLLRWVPSQAMQQDRKRQYEPFFNAVISALDDAVERGREPTWVMSGDADPSAATFGSLLWTYAPVFKLIIGREEIRRRDIRFAIEGNPAGASYSAVDCPIELEERLIRDPETYGFEAPAYLEVTVQTPADEDHADPLITEVGQFT